MRISSADILLVFFFLSVMFGLTYLIYIAVKEPLPKKREK